MAAIAIACVGHMLLAWGGGTTCSTARAQDASYVRAVEQTTQARWLSFARRTAGAIVGVSPDDAMLTTAGVDLETPPEQRVAVLLDAIEAWMESDGFVKQQTETWVRDRIGGESESDSRSQAWDYRLHDRWLSDAVRDHMPFDRFVRLQLHSDSEDARGDQSLATASWYRSNGWLPVDAPRTGDSSIPPLEATAPSASFRWTQPNTNRGVFWEAKPVEVDQLRNWEKAIQKIQNTERLDWERLSTGDAVRVWHRDRSVFPVPDPKAIVFEFPGADRQVATSDLPGTVVVAIESALGKIGEWSLVLDLVPSPTANATPASTPFLIRQSNLGTDPSTASSQWLLRLEAGRPRFQMIHDARLSKIDVEASVALDPSVPHQLAILYDGLQSAASLRMAIDGELVPCTVWADTLVKDFVEPGPQMLSFDAPEQSDAAWTLEAVTGYRITLTSIELMGLSQDRSWKSWIELNESERMQWCEYYARRIDPQWRYQRDSLLFYASNYANLWQRVPTVPIPKSDPLLGEGDAESMRGNNAIASSRILSAGNRFPDSVLPASMMPEGAMAAADRKRLAGPWPRMVEAHVSEEEADRQWRNMLASASLTTGSAWTEEERQAWGQRFRDSGWNSKALVRSLVLDDQWIAIALDSAR